MNSNKRGVQAIGSTEAGGRYYSAQQGESEGEEERRKTKGKQKEKTLSVIATPLPKLLTTTVINCNSTLATAVIAN